MSTHFTRGFLLSIAIGVVTLSGCAARERLEPPAPIAIPDIAVPDVSTPDINTPETRNAGENGHALQRARTDTLTLISSQSKVNRAD